MTTSNTIILTDGLNFEAWGSLTEICKAHKDFSYTYLKNKKYPFTYKGVQFVKVPYRSVNAVSNIKQQ